MNKNLIIENALHLTPTWIALSIFILAYILVILEEFIQLRKSKPMVLTAGIIWVIVAYVAEQKGLTATTEIAIRNNLMDYAEILLFVIVAMTYINALTERRVFESLRSWLIQHQFTYRELFWITGVLSFFLSALADNLTTALAMSAVITAVGKGNPRFVCLACINLVVAANAGGAFSPFGDITTLMVWQAGLVPFTRFFKLFLPAVINFLIPAVCMHFAVSKGRPGTGSHVEKVALSKGGKRVIFLALLTIATAVYFQSIHLPPAVGMMMGLAYLQFFAYYTQYSEHIRTIEIFPAVKELDWDTLLFFYGVILAVGGLATLGFLELVSNALYTDWGANLSSAYQHAPGNIIIGVLSAIVDNIPLMFSVIKINPNMSQGQWLLITLTAGVGGSLLSIGSAAGIGVMGQANKIYTFFAHLKWTCAIAIGYAASIAFHLWWNADLFSTNL